jgi:hypothetical protein
MNYTPPRKWKRVWFNSLKVKAEDGTVAWLNVAGLAGLETRDGYYIVLPVSFADGGGDPYGRNYGPPPRSRPLRLEFSSRFRWSKDRRPTDRFVPPEQEQLYYDSIAEALRTMGYTVVTQARPSSDPQSEG